MIHTDAIGSRTHLNVSKHKKESWNVPAPWKYQKTGVIIGVFGAGLQSPLTNNFAHLLDLWSNDLIRLEHVDGEGLPFDYHEHHMFLFPLVHFRSVGSQIAYSEDDNVNSVAPGTARPSSVKHRKAMKKHRKPSRTILENHGLPRRMQVFRTVCNHAAKPKGSSSCIRMLFVVILVVWTCVWKPFAKNRPEVRLGSFKTLEGSLVPVCKAPEKATSFFRRCRLRGTRWRMATV